MLALPPACRAPIEEAQAAAIRAAIAAAKQAEEVIEEGHTRAVPFPDTRGDEARAADAEVLEQVLGLRQQASEARRQAARDAVVQRAARSEAEVLMAKQSAEAAEASAAAQAEKLKKPWPPKVRAAVLGSAQS